MENQQKRRSRNGNRPMANENVNTNDNTLKKKAMGFVGVYMIIIVIVITLFLSGCTKYKEEYNECINITNSNAEKAKAIIENKTKMLNECWNNLEYEKNNNKTIITKYIQNNTMEQEERQRWSLELAWCKSEFKILNESDGYVELKRNYTGLQYEYEKCNNTLMGIGELYKKWE